MWVMRVRSRLRPCASIDHIQETSAVYIVGCYRVLHRAGNRTQRGLVKDKAYTFGSLAAIVRIADIAFDLKTTDAIDTLNKAIGCTTIMGECIWLVCPRNLDNLPTVTINLNGVEYQLSGSDYVLDMDGECISGFMGLE